jgi:hypothetical protein
MNRPKAGYASNALTRLERGKTNEERRHLDAFLMRLGLVPSVIEKCECPDFFMQFNARTRATSVGCEVVRFQAWSEGASKLGHAYRWKRFAERLRSALVRSGLGVYGVIHLHVETNVSFDLLLADEARTISEICGRLEATSALDGVIVRFDPVVEPTLLKAVERIEVRASPLPAMELWWCASLQSGLVAESWPALHEIVASKSQKAASWNWRSADERWLLVVGEAQTLSDTMILFEPPEHPTSTSAFSHVFAWSAFFEQVHQVFPTFQTIFELQHNEPVLHRSAFMSKVGLVAAI